MLVPRGQLKDKYSASQPAFWYVLKVPASKAANKRKEKRKIKIWFRYDMAELERNMWVNAL